MFRQNRERKRPGRNGIPLLTACRDVKNSVFIVVWAFNVPALSVPVAALAVLGAAVRDISGYSGCTADPVAIAATAAIAEEQAVIAIMAATS